jgi:transcriptional regulator with XRE-family HTH domain
MDSLSEIMQALRAGRALVGLSQEEVAERAGLSRQIIVRLEKGDGNVLVDAVQRTRTALEREGVIFIDGNENHGPAVAMYRRTKVEDV